MGGNEVEITVKVRNDTAGPLSRIRAGFKQHLRDMAQGAEVEGKRVGSMFLQGIKQTFTQLAPAALSDSIGGALKGALSSPVIGPIITAALVGVVAVAAPAVATAAAGALALGFGTAFVGIGAMLLMQNDKIKKQFSDTFGDIKNTLTDAFKPLIPVLDVIRGALKGLADFFAPFIKQAAEVAKGPLIGFIHNLEDAFKKLAPAIEPFMKAFGDILNQLGPSLPGLFESIGKSLGELAKTISENSDIIAGLFAGIAMAIPPVIDAIGGMTRFFRSSLKFLMDALDKVAGAFAGFLHAIAHVPGFEWAEEAARKLDGLGDTFRSVKAQIERNEIEAKLKANISDLQTKIATAKQKLKDPDLTKERRAALKADISQLKSAVSAAQARINSLHGKTVVVTVVQKMVGAALVGAVSGRRSGGIVGAAGGGPRGNMTLVGEGGPELVRLPFGSQVTPAGQTAATLAASHSDGGTTVNLYVQGSILTERDLIRIVRDEFGRGGFRGVLGT